jgi:eukaryotic-like serine/threonine-protein kinase
MDPRRKARIEDLFEGALELPPSARDAWLETACADDQDLAEQIRALLGAHGRSGGIVDRRLAPSPPPPPERERAPRPIGPYRILEEVGRGGMSVVYRAERSDGHFRRRVALKVLRGGLDGEELHARLSAERQILASLDHPNIARLLDGGVTEEGRPYLVMEYVDGEPLTGHCDQRRLSIEDRLHLFLQVLRAVQHAHARLVVHRDLKPSNILVTGEGQVRLLDFGIAKVLDFGEVDLDGGVLPVTRTGIRLFTPEYASPEQLRGEPASVANDIWALGVVLYEVLVGGRPFEARGGGPLELERAILEEDPPAPSIRAQTGPGERAERRGLGRQALHRALRGDLDRITAMALRKEPDRRYASAEQFADDLERFLDGRPVRAQADRAGYRIGKFLRRHRLETAAVVLVVISVLVGAGAAIWQAEEARRERDRAEAAAVRSEAATAYLVDLFRSTDPWEIPVGRLTARELLARGERRLEELPDDPLLRARLLLAMGESYRSLGDAGAARPLIEESLEIRRREVGPDHPETSAALLALADLLRGNGNLAGAEALALEALEASRARSRSRAGNPDVTGEAAALTLLGFIHTGMGRLPDALDEFQASLGLLRGSGLGHVEEVGHALINVAAVNRRLRRLEQAEAYLREALEHRRRHLGPEHPLTAVSMARLAGLLSEHLGRYDEAGELFEEALELQSRVLGPDHPARVEALGGLAVIREVQGDWAGAEAFLRESYRTHRAGLGDAHPSTLATAEGLAVFLAGRGSLHEADSILNGTLPARRAILGPSHPGLATSLANRGRVLARLGRLDQAESDLREALKIREEVFGPEHPLFGLALVDLSEVNLARGDWSGREALLARGLGILEEFHAPGHPEIDSVRVLLTEARRHLPARALPPG